MRTHELHRVLSARQVSDLTSLSTSTIWRLRRAGQFPQPDVQLTPGRLAWTEGVVARWLAKRRVKR